jgi:glycosyltransferase involved in cell wall biosynthesis
VTVYHPAVSTVGDAVAGRPTERSRPPDGRSGGNGRPAADASRSRRSRAARPFSAVCLLTGEFPPDPGGVGDYTARLSEALAALGVPVAVLTARRPDRPVRRSWQRADGGEGPAIPVHARVPAWDFRSWPAVGRVLGRLGPRPILHIQYQAGAFGLQGALNLLPLWMRATRPAARVVTTFHDFRVPYLFPKAGPFRVGANRLLARASHAAVFTEPADLLAAGTGALRGGRGYLIPIGSNVDRAPPPDFGPARVRRALGADEATVLIGYFGFLNATKGVPTLLRALAALAADGRRVRLALIGAEAGPSDPTALAPAREVYRLQTELGLDGLVARTGYLPPAELSAALLACDVIALPYRDGASLRRGTLMAAIAHARPIVSTRPNPSPGPSPARRGGNSPLSAPGRGARGEGLSLRDGEHLLLVPPDDPAALAGAIARLADDPGLRARLAANAGALADRIAWPEIARQTLAVYETVSG